ncbi:MAG: hypothetical protein ABR549_10835 [Mycobacteriales bacterium]
MTSAVGMLLMALALPVLPLTAAGAAGDPGSGFGSVSLHAVAHGQEFLFRSEIPAQLSVPYAASNLQLGEGVALATVAWPGDTAAALGTTAVLLGGPDQLRVLNDPAVASARSGTGDADVTNTAVPGTTMHATATKRRATALAAADGSSAAATTAGSSSSQSAVELTGETLARGIATSTVRDVTVGVVHVDAVTSTTTGMTDGLRASANGSTTVTGLTVGGVPVTVDEHGVSVAGAGVVPPGAADAVTSALQRAQITLALTKPVKAVAGGRVEYSTGALVATTPLGTLTLGGAQLVLSATRDDDTGPVVPLPTSTPGGTTTLPGDQPPVEVQPGGSGQPPAVPAPTALPQSDGPLAAVPLSLRTGYGWAWVAAGLLLTFLAASGLLALNRRWLAPDLSGCPLERRLP